jgi:hypothetical protein
VALAVPNQSKMHQLMFGVRTIYIATTSHELDDSVGKLAFDCTSLFRLYVQNRGHASVFADRLPLWVISGHFAAQSPCPLYSQKQTSLEA